MSVISLITKKPLLPVIQITKDDASTYTFNSFTSTFDFRVRSFMVEPPFDAIGGKFKLVITSGTNSGNDTILTNISEGNELVVWIGKDDSSKTKMFRGVIESITLEENTPDYYDIVLSGPDWGSDVLKHRVVNGQWVQRRDSTGAVLTTDNSTLITQIVQDILTKDQSYPLFLNGAPITVEDQGVVVDSANITVPTLQIPQFSANMEYVDDKLQELDDIAFTVHYVDPDKNFIMRAPEIGTSAVPASIILTDDNSDSTAAGWISGKVGFVGSSSQYIRTLENHRRLLYGLGGNNATIDQSYTTTSSNTQLDTNYLAQKFTPTYPDLHDVAVYVSVTGTPTNDFAIDIREDLGGLPVGKVLRTLTKDPSFLNDVGASGAWTWFDIGEELVSNADYWIVLHKNGDATNTFRWHRDNTDNNPSTSATSSDDVTWAATGTPNRYKYSFITRYNQPLLTYHVKNATLPSATSKHFHEEVIRKADITKREPLEFLLTGIGNTAFKRKDIMKCPVYAPDTLLQTGQKVRIRKQASGYKFDDNFILGKIEYMFEGSEDLATGTFYYNVEAVRFVDFA